MNKEELEILNNLKDDNFVLDEEQRKALTKLLTEHKNSISIHLINLEIEKLKSRRKIYLRMQHPQAANICLNHIKLLNKLIKKEE